MKTWNDVKRAQNEIRNQFVHNQMLQMIQQTCLRLEFENKTSNKNKQIQKDHAVWLVNLYMRHAMGK